MVNPFPKSQFGFPHFVSPWLHRCCHFEWTTARARWTEYPPRLTVFEVENTKLCKRNIWDLEILGVQRLDMNAFQLRMWVVRVFVIAASPMNISRNEAIATKAVTASRLANCRVWSSSLEFECWNFVFSKLDYAMLQYPEAEETLNVLARVGSQITT